MLLPLYSAVSKFVPWYTVEVLEERLGISLCFLRPLLVIFHSFLQIYRYITVKEKMLMSIFQSLTNNKPLVAGIIAWFIAQMIKVTVDSIFARKIVLKGFFASGGMPSSHSSLVSSMTTVIGKTYGLDSVYFAICAVFSLIVMYDAFHVRRSAGEQAKAVNKIIEVLTNNNVLDGEETLKVILGHSPLQVFAGMILGLIVGFVV